jgi:trigger factor
LNGRVQTEVEELPENRVRLRVQVPRDDVHHAIEHAATDLAASVKIPGFRKGKVPMPVLLQRVGKDRLYTEAIESHIGGWFWNAAARQRLRPVEQPHYDFELPTSDGEDWEFTATVAVQAKPEIGDWTTLEVPYREPEVPQELVEQELRILQDTVATLAPVEGRPVQEGDTVVVDLLSGDETRTDYVVELGRGAVVEEIEQGLVSVSVGDTKEIDFELGDDSSQSVTVTVKEIKEKVLPPLDDDLARAATEFDTIAELRADIEGRLHEQLAAEADAAFRGEVVDKLVEAFKVEAAGPLVESRTRELLAGLARQVERRGINFESYLTMTGTDPNELVSRLRTEAAQSVARELALEAAADKLGLEVPDADVEALVRDQAEAMGDDASEVLLRLRESGRIEQLRDDLRLRNALDRIAGEVKRVSPERDAIWTPDKEKPERETKLWTPGSKEPA